ncbi:hypothetical protein C8R43DRAFT_1101077 [Mycena crocata]|nr:hypothetical protein C8R43DRAFT_1101077 [Mycena crocata]
MPYGYGYGCFRHRMPPICVLRVWALGIPLSTGQLTPRNVWAALQQSYFCARPTWSENEIPSLSDQVVVVTGKESNAGLGKETVQALLQHGAKVYMACRSREKANEAIAELPVC